jgi:hypothetical protein
MRRRIFMLGMVAVLYGCIGGERVKLDAHSPSPQKDAAMRPIALAVSDERESVQHGGKEQWYLGEAAGPHEKDLSNHQLIPLAHQIRNDLVDELEAVGFEDAIRDDVRKLKVGVREWYVDGDARRLRYRIDLAVLERDDAAPAATSVVQGEKALGGADDKAMKAGLKRAYAEIVRSLVRENPTVLDALRRIPDPPPKK